MKPKNLISTLQGDRALNMLDRNIGKEFKTLKSHEIRVLDAFCKDMISYGCEVGDFDGFFVSYEIPQISKEFDLLRFGVDCVLNIELKSELKVANKHQKIFDQLRKNEYYLKFLGKPTKIFACVENDGYYSYTPEDNKIEHIAPHVLSVYMKTMVPDYTADPDRMFIPSNYLVSPFNATAQFIKGEYFLTSAQQKIREEFLGEAEKQELSFFCISANAGTGKTLLLYDIAKEILNRGKHVKIIHCGLLNEGHKLLRDNYGWDIVPIRNMILDNSDGSGALLPDQQQFIKAFENKLSSLLSQKQNEAKQLEIEAVRQREVDYKNALQEIEDFLSTDDRLVGMSKKGVRQEYADTLRIRWSEKIGQNITQKDVRIIVERVYLRRMTNQNA